MLGVVPSQRTHILMDGTEILADKIFMGDHAPFITVIGIAGSGCRHIGAISKVSDSLVAKTLLELGKIEALRSHIGTVGLKDAHRKSGS